MALERKWDAVPPRAFTSNGTANGVVTVEDTIGFYTKSIVIVKSDSQQPANFQVLRVLSPTQILLGLMTDKVGVANKPLDLSSYTVLDNATIAAGEQDKNNIPEKDHYAAVYVADPVVADRVIFVDPHGDYYGDGNPLPIAFDGTISVGNVTIQDDDGDEVAVNQDGSLNVAIVQTGSEGLSDLGYQYSEVNAVPAGVETTVLTILVPSGQKRIQKIEAAGTNVAEFRIKRNGNVISKKYIWHGAFNATFDFEQFINGIKLLAGETLTVTTIHNRPDAGDFNATAWYL